MKPKSEVFCDNLDKSLLRDYLKPMLLEQSRSLFLDWNPWKNRLSELGSEHTTYILTDWYSLQCNDHAHVCYEQACD